jgi:hypothetical protein
VKLLVCPGHRLGQSALHGLLVDDAIPEVVEERLVVDGPAVGRTEVRQRTRPARRGTSVAPSPPREAWVALYATARNSRVSPLCNAV